jgi:phosphoglycerol geranylgeranyltransferase
LFPAIITLNTLKTFQFIHHQKVKGNRMLAVLIDPEKTDIDRIKDTAKECQSHGVQLIFIGGSMVLQDKMHELIKIIKTEFTGPVILFPGNGLQLHPSADALLLLSLISGRNAELLIGKHVEASGYIKESQLEVISTGYMLVECGPITSVQYMSQTLPIPYKKNDIAVATAMAGEMLGLKCIYMDGGSGAERPIHPEMIQAVKKSIQIPLMVGGGIRNRKDAEVAWNAGADIVVIGTAIENDISLLKELMQ